jgi:putative aldouronate transport system substrate-binding protein
MLTLGLAMVLCVGSLLTGCSSDKTTDTTTKTGTNETKNEGSATNSEEKIDITIVTMQGFVQPDSWLEKRWEEKYNVNIELLVLPGWSDGEAKVNLLMADEDQRPDVIWWWGLQEEYKQWVDAGLLVNVAPYMEKYPNMKDYYSETGDALFFAQEADGGIYRIPGDVAEESCTITLLRKDWLDNLGLTVPTTIEEYMDVLRAFTFNDPDRNGESDTYGFVGEGLSIRSFWPFYGAYGANPEKFVIKEDGSVVYGATQPEVKEALKAISQLYEEGVIDSTIVTQNKIDEIFAAGKWGSMYRWISAMNPSDGGTATLKVNSPGAELAAIEPIAGPNGDKSEYFAGSASWCYFAITNTCEDPERVYSMFDDLASEDNWKEKKFGIEGEHYTYENGVFTSLLEDGQNEADNIGLGLLKDLFARKDSANIVNTPEVNALFEQSINYAQVIKQSSIEFKTADRPVWKQYGTELETLRDQYIYGIISGTMSIDAFDEFVEKFYQIGGKEVEAEAAELYKAQVAEYEEYNKNK